MEEKKTKFLFFLIFQIFIIFHIFFFFLDKNTDRIFEFFFLFGMYFCENIILHKNIFVDSSFFI